MVNIDNIKFIHYTSGKQFFTLSEGHEMPFLERNG